MRHDSEVAWAAGLIEGEGYFASKGRYSMAISVSSTDKDVLERLIDIAGGSLYELPRRAEHHKDTWRWDVFGPDAVQFTRELLPFLLARRSARAQYLLDRYDAWQEEKRQKTLTRQRIQELWDTGLYSEAKIGEMTGTNRSYVNAVRRGQFK